MAVKWLDEPEAHDYDAAAALRIADGCHRVCASYVTDENTDIPCYLVSWQ